MIPVPVSDILGQVRALLNDQDDQIYHDNVVLPFFRQAYDDLRLAAENYSIPITNASSAQIVLPAGALTLGSDGNPSLPQDLVEILSISERPAGQETNYIRLRRKEFLPHGLTQTAYLGIWSWQNQIVKFVGATGDIDLKLDYVADPFGVIINENSVVQYTNCRNYLQYRTAALCAGYIGENESRRDSLNNEATILVDLLLNQAIKTKQSIATRRHGFRRNRRYIGW